MKNLESFMICERMKKTYDKNIDTIITKKLQCDFIVQVHDFQHFNSDCTAQNNITSKLLSKFMEH